MILAEYYGQIYAKSSVQVPLYHWLTPLSKYGTEQKPPESYGNYFVADQSTRS
jgi:hypothetical protein